jgi:hypothetical protein
MNTARKIAACIATLGLIAAAGAQAATPWQYEHPRRAEVNERLASQNYRIDREVARGTMSAREGAYLHREDRAIRGEERSMAAANGGYISRGEQHMLNRQENAVSRQIRG